MSKKKQPGSKQRILDFFAANVGKVVDSRQIQEASGWAAEWARRVRELRNEEGYEILSHKDRDDLRPGQYILLSMKRRPAFKRAISKSLRALVLERNGYTCQMCGVGAGDPDPLGGPRTVRLTIGHIVDKSRGGEDKATNLRAVCEACNEGLQNSTPMKPDTINLMTLIRKATIDDQRIVLDWLLSKFRIGADGKS